MTVDRPTDTHRLLFGAGFVFGAMTTLIVLAIATVAVAGLPGAQGVLLTIAAGVLFLAILGVTLFLLAFPNNRVELSDVGLFGDDEDR